MDADAIYDFLALVEPFRFLDSRSLKDVCAKVEVRRYPKDRFVFRQGDKSLDCLLIIVEGLVELLVTSDRGVESAVGYRKAGDFFSETVVLSGADYPASARAKADLVCLGVDRALLEALIRSHPAFAAYFSRLLSERMRRLYASIRAEQDESFHGTCGLPLFSKKVGEVMTHPVNTCQGGEQVSAVSARMADRGVSSAVVLNDAGRPAGILTESDIVRQLVNRRTYPVDDCRVAQIMNADFEILPPDAFVGQALVAFSRRRFKYLLIIHGDALVGILTATDLVNSRQAGNLRVLQDIRTRSTIDSLAALSREVDGVLNALMVEGASIEETLDVMSGVLERLTRAVIRIAEKKMIADGWGPPPVEYCWINMGSAARHEQTLRTDQDNGIIFADPESGSAGDSRRVGDYFQALAGIVVDGLHRCGFALCSGDVMASNPQWCRSVSEWEQHIDQWGGSFDTQDTRAMTIFLDFRPIWGNPALADRVWAAVFKVLDRAEVTNHMLARDDLLHERPISLLGNIRTPRSGPHKDTFNLKTQGLVHLINGIRIYALNHRIAEASTLGRLERLTRKGVFSEDTADLFKTAFETLMRFKIEANMEKAAAGRPADNHIRPSALRKKEKDLLKDALLAVVQMQKRIAGDFNSAWIKFFSG